MRNQGDRGDRHKQIEVLPPEFYEQQCFQSPLFILVLSDTSASESNTNTQRRTSTEKKGLMDENLESETVIYSTVGMSLTNWSRVLTHRVIV